MYADTPLFWRNFAELYSLVSPLTESPLSQLPIQFSHANGFGLPCYQHFLSFLAPHPVYGVERFGQGKYQVKHTWAPMTTELIDAIEAHQHVPMAGVGHSLGGVLTLWAAIKRPELFKVAIMIDPPIFSQWKRLGIRLVSALGMAGRVVPPAKKAKRRRRYFPSREEAYQALRQRSLFRDFEEACFMDYINHGLVPEGEGFGLAIPAEEEYKIFSLTPFAIGDTKLKMPSYFLYSESKQVLQDPDLAWLKANLTHTEFIALPGGHMYPMEKPQHMAGLIKELIQQAERR
jgi:pimeloyl-ACP methyl ester carboxylesterase